MLKVLKDALTRPKLRLTQADLCLTQAQTCLTQAKFCPNSAKKSPNSNFRRVVVSARQKSAEKKPWLKPKERVLKNAQFHHLFKKTWAYFVFYYAFYRCFIVNPLLPQAETVFITRSIAILRVQFHRCNVAEILLFSLRRCHDFMPHLICRL